MGHVKDKNMLRNLAKTTTGILIKQAGVLNTLLIRAALARYYTLIELLRALAVSEKIYIEKIIYKTSY